MRRVGAVALLLGIVVAIQLGSTRTSSAWNLTGHRWIALDALTALPDPMREIPIVSLRGTPPPPRSEAADAFQRFATDAEEMIRLGRGLD